jgi:RHS repeat-associated protein
MDFDRDGRDEVVLVAASAPVVEATTQSTQNDFTTARSSSYDIYRFTSMPVDFSSQGVGEAFSMPYAAGFPIRSFAFLAGDLNGDLKPDIIRDRGTSCTATGSAIARCPVLMSSLVVRSASEPSAIGSPFAFSAPSQLLRAAAGGAPLAAVVPAGAEQFILDVDGDGAPELLSREVQNNGTAGDGSSPTLRAFSARQPVPFDTKLHAQVMQWSETGSAALGVLCNGTGPGTNGFVRYFADIDGDGQTDSLSLPSVERDNCGVVRDWAGLSFVSRNVGGQFLPATPERVTTDDALIGPTVLANQSGSVSDGTNFYIPTDWQSPFRNVDNGLRFADLNRDGRADLVLLGDYTRGLVNGPPRRTSPFVRFGNSLGGFGSARAVSSVGLHPSYLYLGNGVAAGRGPRDRRLGDFNGDGLLDIARTRIASVMNNDVIQLVVDTQAAAAADAIASVHGQSPNTNVARTRFDYEFAGPANQSLYVPASVVCPAQQRCLKKVGWLVKRQRLETNNFTSSTPDVVTLEHTYGDARTDLNGRGWLGFASHKVANASLGADSTRQMAWTKFELDSTRYAYQRVETVQATGQVRTGVWFSLRTITPTLVVAPECAHRTTSTVATENVTEGGVPVKLTETATSYDAFGNDVVVQVAASDSIRSENQTTRRLGTNAADTVAWLINRYPTLEQRSAVGLSAVTRTKALVYEHGRIELSSVTTEPNAAVETVTTSGLNSTENYLYDNYGNLIQQTTRADGRGGAVPYQERITLIVMDPRDRQYPVETTNPEGHRTARFFESATGLLVAGDDENEQRTEFTYDRYLRPLVATLSSGEVVSMRYSSPAPSSRLRTTIAESDTSYISYEDRDPLGRVTKRGLPSYSLGTISHDYTYDLNSRMTASSLPYRPGTTPVFVERDYDALGRLTAERRPTDTPTSPKLERRWEYSARTTDMYSERNVRTRSEVDFAGREVANRTWIGARQVVTTRQYGPFGVLDSIGHPPLDVPMTPAPASSVLTTTFVYDTLGRVSQINDPDSGSETNLYTPFGELKQNTDANAGVTTRSYDRLGRPTLVETAPVTGYPVPAGAVTNHAQRSIFQWDTAPNGKGRLSSASSVDGVTTTYGYDAQARVSSEVVNIAGEGSFAFGTLYDGKSRVSDELLPAATTGAPVVRFERTYSGLNGDLESVRDATDATNKELLWQLVSRNAAGQTTEEQLGPNASGSVIGRVYDSGLRLRVQLSKNAASGAVFQRLSYAWGADQFLTKKSDLVLGLEETYTHDELMRLTEWGVRQNCRATKWSYGYDDWGNLRTRHQDGVLQYENRYTQTGVTGPVHGLKQLAEGSTVENYRYLAAGQVSTGGPNTFVWRPFGLPSSVTNSNGTVSTYRYDAFGQRVLEVETSGGTTRRIVTLGGRYEKRTDATGGALHSYSIGADRVVGQVRRATNSGGTLYSRHVQYYHSDNLGSPDVISASGQVVDRVKYEPFGERRHHWAVSQPIRASHQANASYGFTGHQPDDAVGLVNMRGRVYNPKTTRFVSPDPVVRPMSEGVNRFSYVYNSPIRFVDPTGYLSVPSALGNGILGPSGNESFESPVMWGGSLEFQLPLGAPGTISTAKREPTSDASSGAIAGPGADGLPPDQIGALAAGLVWAYGNYPGSLDGFEEGSKRVVSKLNDEDWAELTHRMEGIRAIGPLEYFITLRRSVVKESWQTYHHAGLTGTMSVAKLWNDLAFLQGLALLGVAVVYRNQLPRAFAREVAEAQRAGAVATKVTGVADVERAALATEDGTLKYVVTEAGELVVGPKFVNGVEIKHPFLTGSGSASVRAAGEVEVGVANGRVFPIELNLNSGHYRPGPEAEPAARAAFEAVGLVFP